MKRIGILTAGGDTPALNATIYGAVTRANQLKVEVIGLVKGFNCLSHPGVPHLSLNPFHQTIPELDPAVGGSILGSSRDSVDPEKHDEIDLAVDRLRKLGLEGLICIGGDGTLNGLQPLAERFPAVLAPKTIDNDLGLNYHDEPAHWIREAGVSVSGGHRYRRIQPPPPLDLDDIVNYATPGYATAVYVSASAIQRVRTTAESHRRIAIIEVMGRHSGYIALGSAYGMPDIVLVPESPVDMALLAQRVHEIYSAQKCVVIVCGEGVVDASGVGLGAASGSTDPAGNIALNGAAEALREGLVRLMGDDYFRTHRRGNSAREVIFTRKVGHTQRGGRPILFDRFHAAALGAKSLDLLLDGQTNCMSLLQHDASRGFHVTGTDARQLRDKWGLIHARQLHPDLYDPVLMRPTRKGADYLMPIFTNAIGQDDLDHIRDTLFAHANLLLPYQSLHAEVGRRIRYLGHEPAGHEDS